MKAFNQYILLVVEDEEALRDIIVMDLKKKGFTVFESDNGMKAFQIIQSSKIDLVISDMRMPGGHGMDLLEKVRAYHPTIPAVLFITGFAGESETDYRAKGVYQVLSKPFSSKKLMETVLSALESIKSQLTPEKNSL
jgi:DNA-binding NtrC family response regulator